MCMHALFSHFNLDSFSVFGDGHIKAPCPAVDLDCLVVS